MHQQYASSLKEFIRRGARTRLGGRLAAIIVAPPVGQPEWPSLRRTIPISRWFGMDRGLPVDRVYIETFLSERARAIRGCVLEVAEDTYTRRFGGEHVERCDILHARPGNPSANIVADLTDARTIPDSQYDCVLLTQTLQFIFDLRSAVQTLHRILRPGGSVIATVPGISQISRSDMGQWGEFWRFTSASARRLFAEHFASESVTVSTFGNVLSAIAFLHGLAGSELTDEELAYHDPDYEVLIGVAATKNL